MALSDSASSSIPKKASKLNVYGGAVVYCYISQIPCKQTFKKAFDTNGSPRHLNIVS